MTMTGSRRGLGDRFRDAVAFDGPVAGAMLIIHHFVVVGALVVACAIPAIAFSVFVGMQRSHAAVWLGVLALAPLWPAWAAALSTMQAFAERRGHPGSTFRRFLAGWIDAVRRAWWLIVASEAICLVLAYDLAIYGTSTTAVALVAIAAALLWVISTAVFLAPRASRSTRPLAQVTAALIGIAGKPWVALTWAIVPLLVGLLGLIPVVGPTLLLVAPALAALVTVLVAGARDDSAGNAMANDIR